MHITNLSDVISDVTSNTLNLLLIPDEFGTVFDLDVQRWTLGKLDIQYSHALAKQSDKHFRTAILFNENCVF